MNRLASTLLLCAAVVAGTLPLPAAPSKASEMKRASPHETISLRIDGNMVMIVYGRPYSKDPHTGEIRKIWGGLIGTGDNPWGRPWRAGADEATLFITQKPLLVGGTPVPAGAYTLFLVPYEDGTAKLVVNKMVGEWGIRYTQDYTAHELARIDMKRDSLENNVDQFTIDLEKNPAGGGLLEMKWENTQYSVPYAVQK